MIELARWLFKTALYVGVFSVALFVILDRLYMDVVDIRDNNMAPTLVAGDRALVWNKARVDMLNVMLCQHPFKKSRMVMGRAIAFGGSSVSVDRFGNLLINDSRSISEVVREEAFYDARFKKQFMMRRGNVSFAGRHDHEYYQELRTQMSFRKVELKKGAFLLGDNRHNGYDDSRRYGEMPLDNCKGQVFARFKPPLDENGEFDIRRFRFNLLD